MLTNNKPKLQIINAINERIQQNVDKDIAPIICKFVNKFLSTVSYDDLEKHKLLDLYGAIVSFWNYIYQRKPGEIKIRIYNPEFDRFGWESKHTIVEILYEDIPFLVDSIMMAINKRGLHSHLIIHSGDMKFIRDENHKIIDILDFSARENGHTIFEEAPIFIEINRQTDPKLIEELKQVILETINDVSLAVQDWKVMRSQIEKSIEELQVLGNKLDHEEVDESINFLQWLIDDHFTLLGIRNYTFTEGKDAKQITGIVDTGLGVLKQTDGDISKDVLECMPEAGKKLILSKQPLIISKTNTISNIHRPTYTDYIGIKIFDKKGKVIGQKKVVGLFTSIAYSSNPKHIPLIRNKMEQIFIKSKRRPDSHAGKILRNILDNLPRDDLFQGSVDDLLALAKGISYIQERKKIKFFARSDPYEKFISCFVFVPRENFNTDIREKFQSILHESFDAADIQYSTYFSDSVLARINFIVRVKDCDKRQIDIKEIEQKLINISKVWADSFAVSLLEHFGEEYGNDLYNIYKNAFPLSYQEEHPDIDAVYDVALMDKLKPEHPLELNLYKSVDDLSGMIKFKIFHLNNTIPLSDVVPILENMGLKVIYEQPHEIARDDHSVVWLSDFGLMLEADNEIDLLETKEIFQECFHRVWCNKAENDKFNTLILNPILNWHEISLMRAYAKYLQQTRFTFSQQYIEEVLSSHAQIVSKLMTLFHIRFDPSISRDQTKEKKLYDSIVVDLDAVANLDEDRILRRYLELIMVTVRTNFYQKTSAGEHKECLSFKIDSAKLSDLPLPKPMYEIFVYSPRFEGIHLRSSKVARGGIRWSDRREDFRTEVLGLMKAQVVKNAVIVPSGAKGGFVPKRLPIDGSRDEIFTEGLECYKCFIAGLLDLTDNTHKNSIIHPENTVRYDEDDPYFVVAADKGTATFSDVANQISADYGFWLDDAFASGGSTGYDHKKMGITARGAWESVKRHFRSLGVNTQTTPFTVIGIGDMSGDVFGNGMLLSKQIKLIAAFNHLHIFIDPNPDPEKSYFEREKLFNTPRTSWDDYDEKLISKGGGVYRRKAKSVVLSEEAKMVLGIKEAKLSPNELIKKILQAPVDLLWNGGIGTYVKSSKESDLSVGDRNNDNTRVDANELKCKVLGEGGNLGLTQLSRIEYNLSGGLIYTDFIDNSAGVDCSDHEVNIKILLNEIVFRGDMTLKQRNVLLKSMTDEVAELVLNHNYKQTQAISLICEHAHLNLDLHRKYIDELEASNKINRKVEYLPSTEILQERKQEGKGLTSPGIAILFAYSKSLLSEDILHSSLPDDKFCVNVLLDFFPNPIKKKYSKYVANHSLRREIIATRLSNNIINEVGFTFIHRLQNETGANSAEISKAYLVAREIFKCDALREQIDQLDNVVSPKTQNDILMQLIRLMRRTTRWILRNHRENFKIEELIVMYQEKIQEAISLFANVLQGYDLNQYKKKLAQYKKLKLPIDVASYFSMSRAMHGALDCVDASIKFNLPIDKVVDTYFKLGDALELSWIRSEIISATVENSWDALSREALRDDLDWQQKRLVVAILCKSQQIKSNYNIISWKKEYFSLVERWEQILRDIKEQPSTNFTIFFVAIRELLDLTQASSLALPELSKIK